MLVITELFSSFNHKIYNYLYREIILYKVDATTDNTDDDTDDGTQPDDTQMTTIGTM